jgi:hypothetical protein
MSKVKYGILLVLAVAVIGMILPAGASLIATQFGFPTIVQNGQTFAFNNDKAFAQDNEAVAIAFTPTCLETSTFAMESGAAAAVPFCCGSTLGFPTIVQAVDMNQCLTHTDFAYTTENACFSYPFAGVGGLPFPGFGFGF